MMYKLLHHPVKLLCIIGCLLVLPGCKKYLAEKSNQRLATLQTLDDLQALLDNYNVINKKEPIAGEISADDYYVTDASYDAMYYDSRRRMYRWEKDHIFENQLNDWYNVYQPVYYANTVLETLPGISVSTTSQAAWDNVKGQALFIRGKAFFEAATIWAPAYDSTSAGADLGVPLRLSSDFNVPSARASVAETFRQVLKDVKASIPLLPSVPLHVLRPGKAAAYGMLARIYQYMHNPDSALLFANKCIGSGYQLMDFASLDTSAFYPFPQFNSEVIYETCMPADEPLYSDVARIDSLLYGAYSTSDLRKTLFYTSNNDGTYGFRGSYEHGYNLFNGVALDEMYLVRAECYARLGNLSLALQDLNTLLRTRYREGTFIPVAVSNVQDALQLIILERRKELVMRGLRWTDVKRLNQESAGIMLKRFIHGTPYLLEPNDKKYALALPDDIIALSGMQQNP